jgi:hypothetical protein
MMSASPMPPHVQSAVYFPLIILSSTSYVCLCTTALFLHLYVIGLEVSETHTFSQISIESARNVSMHCRHCVHDCSMTRSFARVGCRRNDNWWRQKRNLRNCSTGVMC